MTVFVAIDLFMILLERYQNSAINQEISELIAQSKSTGGETSSKDDVLDKIRMFGS